MCHPYLLPISEFYKCPLDLGLLQHLSRTSNTQLWQPNMVVTVVAEAGGHRISEGREFSWSDKRPYQCSHWGRNNHVSEKCWMKFEKPEWAQVAITKTAPTGSTTDSTFLSPALHQTV